MFGLKLTPLTADLEELFWSKVKQDYCDYYFFIYDWILQRDCTQIFLAMEEDVVAGLMVIYQGHIVQLRGGEEAIRFMLGSLTLDKVDIQVPWAYKNLLLEKYPKSSMQENVTLLRLTAKEAKLSISTQANRLDASNVKDIVDLMHMSYPSMWGNITVDFVSELLAMKASVWLGIKQDAKLVSFGYATVTPKVSHVTWIATRKEYEHRGYATSIVSALVKECLAASEAAMIYVVEENSAANRVYSKVGFKPYKSYFFVRN